MEGNEGVSEKCQCGRTARLHLARSQHRRVKGKLRRIQSGGAMVGLVGVAAGRNAAERLAGRGHFVAAGMLSRGGVLHLVAQAERGERVGHREGQHGHGESPQDALHVLNQPRSARVVKFVPYTILFRICRLRP
jgi:hypothetical protein